MTDIQKPPHATVKWKYRSTSGCEYATHRNGAWEIEVCDQDGDVSYWTLSFQGRKLAEGEMIEAITDRCAMDICMDTALAAMYAAQAEKKDDDH
jgi:hypothetical protein